MNAPGKGTEPKKQSKSLEREREREREREGERERERAREREGEGERERRERGRERITRLTIVNHDVFEFHASHGVHNLDGVRKLANGINKSLCIHDCHCTQKSEPPPTTP